MRVKKCCFLNDLRNFNKIFRKVVTYDNIKSTLSLKSAFFEKPQGVESNRPHCPPPPPHPPSSLFRVNNRPASLLKQGTVTSFKVIKISWRSFSIWQLKTLLQSEFDMSEVYPEPCQISKIKRFAKIVNGISSVIILQNAASLIVAGFWIRPLNTVL